MSFGLLLTGCAPGAGKTGFQMPPTPVEVATVQSRTVRDQFHALGGIASDEQIEVVSELSAVVEELTFVEGQAVEKGTQLARLDDREIRADAERAEAQREQAESNFKRSEKLLEQNAISPQEMDDAKTALKVADANEALAKARLDKTRIRAPFSGLVGRRRVSPGAYLREGEVITDLARVDEMKVTFAAPERYAGLLRPGIAVDAMAPAFPSQHFPGRITVVDPVIDPDTRTVQLVAKLPNPERRLRPGMSANVSVTFAERPGALVVPDEAVFAEGTQSFVFLVKRDSTVSKAPVRLGTRDSARVEILHGLEAGQVVVRAGHQKLYDGAHVMPVGAAGDSGGGPASGSAAR
ncbi:MAG TPA: efflux RND transporter periplasmic adaptor subunit [Candidatus Sulfotelmatobacter sp.]|nr:efflux RND transporter periplasmic adaptor subunit [Candidatus Sulfotelmatobacter sp.]